MGEYLDKLRKGFYGESEVDRDFPMNEDTIKTIRNYPDWVVYRDYIVNTNHNGRASKFIDIDKSIRKLEEILK